MPGKRNGTKQTQRQDPFDTARIRVRVLGEFAKGERRSPKEIADTLGEYTLGTVSYHVRQLEAFGYIKFAGTKQVRGALAHYYRGTEKGLEILADVADTADECWFRLAHGRDAKREEVAAA